jgi:phosphohistidine phosphatase
MGRLMREKGLVPEVILSSTARRARDTASAAAEASGFEGEIRLVRGLYLGDPEAYLEAASQLPDDVAHAMLVGHNPVLEDLVASLVQQAHPMPTAALAVVELPITTWAEVATARGRLRAHWLPRELPSQ